MRLATCALLLALPAASAAAAQDYWETSQDPLGDYGAFATLLIANKNCPGFYYDFGVIRTNMAGLAGRMQWSMDKTDVEFSSHLAQEEKAYRENPSGFCGAAKVVSKAIDG